jgi:hypothetical protein
VTARVATARAVATAPLRRPATTRPSLRPIAGAIPPNTKRSVRLARLPGRLNPVGIAVGLVVVSLLAVVVGNTMLASGQLRLEKIQTQLSAVESTYAAQLALVTTQESPSSVAKSAVGQGLVQPSEILQLPSVPLSKRLGPPLFSSAPCCTLTPGR